MVKKLVLNCSFPSGKSTPVNFYIGSPSEDSHPIAFQSQWLANQYGGEVPSEIMDSMEKLQKISIDNKLRFEDLCEHVFKEVNNVNSINKEKAMRAKQLEHIKKIDSMAAQSHNPKTEERPTQNNVNNEPVNNGQ